MFSSRFLSTPYGMEKSGITLQMIKWPVAICDHLVTKKSGIFKMERCHLSLDEGRADLGLVPALIRLLTSVFPLHESPLHYERS